jgi:integrase
MPGNTSRLLSQRFPTESDMNLTAKNVAAAELPPGKTDHIEWDGEMSGFGYRLRLGSGGQVRRTWVVQYRRAGGSRRVLLGSAAVLTADAARIAAKKLLAAVTLGQDPQADRVDRRSKDQTSLRAVVDEYLKAKQPQVRPRTYIEAVRYLTGKYFKPLHSMPVDQIARKDIAARLVVITRDSGSITAARARATISGFFVWAMQMGYLEQNPVIGTIQPEDSKGRSRVLSDVELAAVWRACKDDDHGRIVRLLILTACRRQEVGGMRWGELDSDRGTWVIPAERAKNKREHSLPLPPAAWDIIQSVPRMASRGHLFGVRSDHGFTAWGGAKEVLDRDLGAIPHFVLHDIRRTVATKLADLGVQPHIIEQILNHQSGHKGGVAGVYNKSSYAREVKTAMALWADHLHALVDGGERKVVNMPVTAA